MIEISAQLIDLKYVPLPMDLEKVKEHKPNQILRIKVYGTEKERSILQMNTYWACCGEVANNTENKKWDTKNKVDFQIRVALAFKDPEFVAVSPDGSVQFLYRSIAFQNLKHIEACNYFDRAFDVMAKFLGCTVEELIGMAKSNMKG